MKVHSVSLFRLLLIGCCFESIHAIDFTCPASNITGGSGVFPPNTNNLTQFPSNYHCELGFEIPDGFVVKIFTNSIAKNEDGDYLFIMNSLNKQGDRSDGSSTYFAPAKSAWVVMNSKSGTAQFWVQYEFIDIRTLQRTYFSTGTVFSLSPLTNRVFTIMSPKNESFIINTDSYAWKDDIFTLNIYVYDGPDVSSNFIGTLYSIANSIRFRTTSGSSLTLVNLYGTASTSYALCNEYSAIREFSTYDFYVFASNFPFENTFADFVGASNAVTFYCMNCNESYMTNLKIETDGQYRSAQFYPLAPTNRLNTFLTYSSKDNLSQYMPQLIPGNLFTLTTDAKRITIQIDNDLQSSWVRPYPGRKGTIFSPSLWTPGAVPSYSWKFESPTPLQFTFNIQSAVITAAGEQLTVEIGSAGSVPFTTTFTNSVSNPGVRVANGTYMLATYSGSQSTSSSIVTFSTNDVTSGTVAPITVTPSSSRYPGSTTSKSIETTTKKSERITVLFSILSFILCYTFIM